MGQINSYSTQAVYDADDQRLATKSAVSYIRSNNEVIYDGVNVIVDKPYAAEGDLAVWDNTRSTLRFVKALTLNKAQLALDTNLVPVGVVVGWMGSDVYFISMTASAAAQWAHSYDVFLGAVSLTDAITVSVTGGAETATVTASGATIAAKVTALNTAFADTTVVTVETNRKWTAAAYTYNGEAGIVLSHNWYVKSNVTATTNCTYTADATDYQTTYAYIPTTEQIERRNGVRSYFGGANYALFLSYYSVNGSTATNTPLHSATILNATSFNVTANPIVYNYYGGVYADYLYGEHFIKYPSQVAANIRGGKECTANLVDTTLHPNTTIKGDVAYPAAWASYNYSVSGVAAYGATKWWLPSMSEMLMAMSNRKLNAASTDVDLVNATLTTMGGSLFYATTSYLWTSSENNASHAFLFSRSNGYLLNNYKVNTYTVRSVSAF